MVIRATREINELYNKLRLLNIELVEITKLRSHEDINKSNLLIIKESLINEGIRFPIVVDKKNKIILDGHHRYSVLKEINIRVVPVFYVNYSNKKIIVDSWNGIRLTKNDIVRAVNSGRIFPCKTTRHMFKSRNGLVHISSIVPRIDINIYKLMNIRCEEI